MYVQEQLNQTHDRSRFDCSRPELNNWLQDSALQTQTMRTSTTTVWHRGDDHVIAYYSLAAHVIQRADLSKSAGHGSPDRIPAVLLARLALDQSLHGEGLGGLLLASALRRIVSATALVGARYAVVDAIDEKAANFYRHYGFAPTPVPRRLVRKISSIAADAGAE